MLGNVNIQTIVAVYASESIRVGYSPKREHIVINYGKLGAGSRISEYK